MHDQKKCDLCGREFDEDATHLADDLPYLHALLLDEGFEKICQRCYGLLMEEARLALAASGWSI